MDDVLEKKWSEKQILRLKKTEKLIEDMKNVNSLGDLADMFWQRTLKGEDVFYKKADPCD